MLEHSVFRSRTMRNLGGVNTVGNTNQFYAYCRGQSAEWYGVRKQTTIWKDELIQDIPDVSVWQNAKDDAMKNYHPTQKPLSLIQFR